VTYPRIPAGELMAKRLGSVDPSKFPDEEFELYSIPAHDVGRADFVLGSDIGLQNKLYNRAMF